MPVLTGNVSDDETAALNLIIDEHISEYLAGMTQRMGFEVPSTERD